jgi:hypothetical protein
MGALKYRAAHWRTLDNGTEDGRRVMMRQVVQPSGEMYAEILDGAGWRRVKDTERFRVKQARLPQVENDWVR